MTDSMRKAIDETYRRRRVQVAYNEERGITPQGIRKAIRDITDHVKKVAEERVEYRVAGAVPKDEIARLVKDLESQMKQAARALEFERAALLRDQIIELRKELISGEDALHEFAKSAYGAAETGRQKRSPGDSWRNRVRTGRRYGGRS
jgi:excinuclease ABC subunit B